MPEVLHDPKFEALVDHLKRTRGFDFSGYKRSSLVRRVQKRMREVEMDDFVEYMDYLQVHPEEFRQLFNTILINVTSFFRDPQAWMYMRDEIIPQIISSHNKQIRIWSAACASGEEAYTLAILFAEALGAEKFRERVKIYATDADEQVLSIARQATYPTKSIDKVPAEYRDKYFQIGDRKSTFRADFRRSIIFGCHDLVQDPPISRLDLVVCRNTLMYFNTETQARVLARLHFALAEHGFLFLGKAEMLLTHADLFSQTDLKHRVFVKTPQLNARDRLLTMIQAGDTEFAQDFNKSQKLREASMDSSLVSQIVVDHAGFLVLANRSARHLFNLTEHDVGRPLQDLEISYRPVELRSLIEQAYSEQQTIKLPKVERPLPNQQMQYLELEISPLYQNGGSQPLGASISFVDVTPFFSLQQKLEISNKGLEAANQELQSAHEELETTNEELQSTNEELETTNEELQSTNEELETMNEELQSTNEELETMNSELKVLTDELNSTNSFLHSVLSSMNAAVIALDTGFKILIWNQIAQELWGLTAEEVVGESIWGLDFGLPISSIKEKLVTFLHDVGSIMEFHVEALNRRGKDIECTIVVTRLSRANKTNRGLLLTIHHELK